MTVLDEGEVYYGEATPPEPPADDGYDEANDALTAAREEIAVLEMCLQVEAARSARLAHLVGDEPPPPRRWFRVEGFARE
jgi:hypothetical protein